jgi:hypothetical protein
MRALAVKFPFIAGRCGVQHESPFMAHSESFTEDFASGYCRFAFSLF